MQLKKSTLVMLFAAALVLVSCAAGNERFTAEEPAGFWYGLWHGVIVVVAFIVSLFSDSVGIYEVNNSGGFYNFGFVLGIVLIGGGSFKAHARKRASRRRDDEWEAIGRKVEKKIMRKLEAFANETDDGTDGASAGTSGPAPDPEWEEIGKKIEQKIKRKLRKWAEEE